MGAKNKGKSAWNKGIHLSTESIKKMSDSHNNVHLSEEHRQRIKEGRIEYLKRKKAGD